jgi:hypothetical protein
MIAAPLLSVVAIALFVAWVIGETRNIRLLRVAGAMAPILIVPIAFEFGSVVGHGHAYVAARSATDEFLAAAIESADDDDSEAVQKEIRWLHERSGDSNKAGGVFFDSMQQSKERLMVRHHN